MDLWRPLLLLALLAFLAKAEPQAEAEAEADAQLMNYGRPPYNSARPPYNDDLYRPPYNDPSRPPYNDPSRPPYFDSSRPPYNDQYSPNPDPGFYKPIDDSGNSGNSVCGLTNYCCGFENQNCCLNKEENCYISWDRVCDPEVEQASCPVTKKRICNNVEVPECGIVEEIVPKTFTSSKCRKAPLYKCWDYEEEVCSSENREHVENVQWENDVLKLEGNETKQKCYDIDTNACEKENYTDTVTTTEQVRVPYEVNEQNCRLEQVKLPDQTITVTQNRPIYRQVCYDIDVPVCTTNPCANYGTCDSGTNVCSTNQFNTQTVCPQPADGISDPNAVANGQYGDCEAVRTPVCSQAQTCNVNYNQQCCRTEKKKMCRQVLVNQPTQVQRVIPGGFKWEKKCNQNPITRYRIEYKQVSKPITRTKVNCVPVTKTECLNITSGDYSIEKQQAFGSVKINLAQCRVEKVTKQHCANLPDAKVDCLETTITKSIRIKKIVCGRKTTKQQCFDIPVATCVKTKGPQQCRMVQRKVCQPQCQQSDYCNTCQDFMQKPGYGSCSTSTCGNFVGGINPYLPPAPGSGGGYPFADEAALLVEDDSIVSDALTS